MNLMGMRFRDFTWQDNPVSLTVSNVRNVQSTDIPYGVSRAEEMGRRRRTVAGEGYFSGQGCMEQWQALQDVFALPGPGLLQLPGVTPFWALMDSLELIGAQGKDLVRYAFSFVEWDSKEAYLGSGVRFAKAGESLWDYANRWGISVEALVEANPQIRDICDLQEGEKVVIP
ncbi:MAG: DNA circularization N-terminal domain-containing protein [Acutalibacter sp.]|jgi:hypothetical protein